MRMASWRWGGVDHAGTVSLCGRGPAPMAVPQPDLGVLRQLRALENRCR